jgi:hypothetical protein
VCEACEAGRPAKTNRLHRSGSRLHWGGGHAVCRRDDGTAITTAVVVAIATTAEQATMAAAIATAVVNDWLAANRCWLAASGLCFAAAAVAVEQATAATVAAAKQLGFGLRL